MEISDRILLKGTPFEVWQILAKIRHIHHRDQISQSQQNNHAKSNYELAIHRVVLVVEVGLWQMGRAPKTASSPLLTARRNEKNKTNVFFCFWTTTSHSETGPFCKGSELRLQTYPLQIQCVLLFKGFRTAIFLEAF